VEPGSPFRGESQLEQVPLKRIRQGLMTPPPPIQSGPSGFTCLSQVILAENPDCSMPAHMKGREGNLPVETQRQSLRISGPLNGAPGAPTAGHPLCHFIPLPSCSKWL
jgi:hypothetical protein